jgi:hypothetical protein
MTPLHVLRKQRETSPEFFDSWADERMLIGRKTREHIGIHVAKENETPRMIAKQLNIEPPELLLQLNADWYPELQLSDKFKASTKLMYETTGLDRVLEGTVLGQVDPDGYTSPFWRVEYPALASSSDDSESFVLERTLKEVWDGCWAWEAHADDWKLSGNPHIGQRVAKAVDNETRMEIQIEVAAEEQDDTPDRRCHLCANFDQVESGNYSSGSAYAPRPPPLSWKWVMGQVVGFGGDGADDLDEHGDQVWRVHYEDYDSEDLNHRQLMDGIRKAKVAQNGRDELAVACSCGTTGIWSDEYMVKGQDRRKRQRHMMETVEAAGDGQEEVLEEEELLEDQWSSSG